MCLHWERQENSQKSGGKQEMGRRVSQIVGNGKKSWKGRKMPSIPPWSQTAAEQKHRIHMTGNRQMKAKNWIYMLGIAHSHTLFFGCSSIRMEIRSKYKPKHGRKTHQIECEQAKPRRVGVSGKNVIHLLCPKNIVNCTSINFYRGIFVACSVYCAFCSRRRFFSLVRTVPGQGRESRRPMLAHTNATAKWNKLHISDFITPFNRNRWR